MQGNQNSSQNIPNSPPGISPTVDLSVLKNLSPEEIKFFQANNTQNNPSINTLETPQQPQQPQQQQPQQQQQQQQLQSQSQEQQIQDPQKVFALYKQYLARTNELEKENKALKLQMSGGDTSVQNGINGNGNGNGNDFQQYNSQLNQKHTLEQQIAELQKQKTDLEIQSLSNKGQWDKVTEIQLKSQEQNFNKQITSLSNQVQQLRQEKEKLNSQLSNNLLEKDQYARKQLAFREFVEAGGDPLAFDYVWTIDLEPNTRLNQEGKLQAYNPVTQTYVTDDSGQNPVLINNLINDLKQRTQARFFTSGSQIPGFGLQNQGFGYNPNNRQPTVPDTSKPLAVSKRIMQDRNYQKQIIDRLGGANLYELMAKGKIIIDESMG